VRIWIANSTTKQQLADNINQHKTIYRINGFIFLILGVLCLLAPIVAAEILNYLIGGLLLLTALIQMSFSYLTKRHWSYYIGSTIYLLAGLFLVVRPNEGVMVLAAVVGIFLLLQGCVQIFSAGLYAPFPGWQWVLFSGLVSLSLAGIIYSGWPATGVWLLGIMLGVNFVVFGLSMIMLTRYS
jgi:uncharacterized membrane protein HdeD (DUF308 family)